MSAASDITRRAKSNLAFALRVLPKDRRDDAVVFYAFCRTVDDLADETASPAGDRRSALTDWKTGLLHGFIRPDDFQREVVSMLERRKIPSALPAAIIDGCLMDLESIRFEKWEDLEGYIWKVACAVGLVSIRLFGCTEPESETYAVSLGKALQITNILRDVNEDLSNGRLYLPLETLSRHGLTETDLPVPAGDRRFATFATEMADRAQAHFDEAAATLPKGDRAALKPARIMSEIYETLLHAMRADGFRVFEKRYRLTQARKLAILSKHLFA